MVLNAGDMRALLYQAICSAAKLSLCHSQGHKLHCYVKFMQKSVVFPLCVRVCDRTVRDVKSFHLDTFAPSQESTCNWL